MYSNLLNENGWADLAQICFQLFVIAKRRFLRKKILGKPSRKVGKLEKSKIERG